MSIDDNEKKRKSVYTKQADLSTGNAQGISEIGFPNNKDKGKGKKGGIVGKG
ncbi:hypothetical protein [Clostridium sp. C2-6-12]|uniref:hypothetical protein n=1 Tax=Clostridium sp. C2-6-12 TaxID=2698832 RepID=UPI00136AECD6|nr:hypothetical protein [Clostridium sp. C2-6-12]